MKAGAKLIVQGTVQGVFFRQFVKEQADNLGLKGFVRNLTNGDLEIVVEGEKERIGRLANALKKGPPHSQVKNIQIEEKKWSGDLSEFKILRF